MIAGGPPDVEAWSRWRQDAIQPDVDAALRGLYHELDDAVAARGPTCWQSGKCCNFDAFGHRLYVTALEIAWFLAQVAPPETSDHGPRASSDSFIALPQLQRQPGVCPYQVDRRCTTHDVRPMGCRVFFCQQGTERWQQDLYETFLDRLRQLHESRGIEYRYLDWMAGLSEAAAAAGPGGR